MATPSKRIESTNPRAVLSHHEYRALQKERSVEIRKVKRATKERMKAIGSVWD